MDNSTNSVEMSRNEKQSEYHRKWYAENKEHVLAYRRKWYAENKERVMANKNEWITKNRERINQQSRERYRNDPDFREKQKLYNKKWKTNHPDAVKAGKLRYYVNALRREGYTVIPPEGVEG